MGYAPRWQLQSYFGGGDEALPLPGVLSAPCCVATEHAGVSWWPAHRGHGARGPSPDSSCAAMPALRKAVFGIPPLTALPPQLADLQMRNATARRLIKSLQGMLYVSA